MNNALSKLSGATTALAEARTLDEVKQILDIAEAARTYARAAKLGLEAQNHAAEIKLRAERKAGEMLRELEKFPEGRPQKLNQPGIVSEYRQVLDESDIAPTTAHRWQIVATLPEELFEEHIAETKGSGHELTSAGVAQVAQGWKRNGGSPIAPEGNPLSIHYSSETPEHYTPDHILTLVSEVTGGIDLDPCSNSKTSPHVPALAHYTAEDDGLALPWRGSVFMNPPYGRVIGEWIKKLIREFESGNVCQAIALVPARTDTEWWDTLISCAGTIPLICFVRGRLTFVNNSDPAPFPSALVYLGDNRAEFYSVFSSIGRVWAQWNDELAGLVDYGSA